MPPVGTEEQQKKRDFASNLQAVLARTGVEPHIFADQFAKSTKLRRAVALEYLAGIRRPYGDNLEKLAEYLRRYVAGLQPADFELPPDEFDKRLERVLSTGGHAGESLRLRTISPSTDKISKLVGSYRLFRYGGDRPARILSEAVSIFEERASGDNSVPDLRMRAWPIRGNDNLYYEGPAIIMNDQITFVLTHVSDQLAATRALMVRLSGDDKLLVGSALLDHDGRTEKADVVLEKKFGDAGKAKDQDWRKIDAAADVSKDVLLALGPAKAV